MFDLSQNSILYTDILHWSTKNFSLELLSENYEMIKKGENFFPPFKTKLLMNGRLVCQKSTPFKWNT